MKPFVESRKLNFNDCSLYLFIFSLLVITFISCNEDKEYNYPKNTFMENLEYPFSDEIFLHCGEMFNFMDYVYYPKFDTNYIVSEKAAHIYENDTTQYYEKCQYVINSKDNFLMIDGGVDDYVIYWRSLKLPWNFIVHNAMR